MIRLLVVVLGVALGVLLTPSKASAHPLGDFTVNHYHGVTVRPDRVDVRAIVDLAEIPTLQEHPSTVDGYADRECAEVARTTGVEVDGRSTPARVRSAVLESPVGQAGLPTTRLTCALEVPASGGRIVVRDSYRPDRIGWREMTAAGAGVTITSSAPTASVSGELRAYPDDLLADPPDVREVALTATPGGSTPAGTPGGAEDSLLTKATKAFTGLVGDRDLTPWVGILAVLLALLLGASHAALPGHGKTVIAAYLAGRAGTPRDALVVGATVTLTHTAGVLVLGLVISASSTLAGESALRWLGVASGALVAAVGAFLVVTTVRRTRDTAAPGSGHERGHGHGHGHGTALGHGHGHGHRLHRAGLVGMGVAGGLVPSPSALVVLLGAIALGRTWFGVLLVLGYGLGMAVTLTAVGLLLVRLRDRLHAVERFRDRFTALPALTASLVLVVGLGLTVRSAVSI
ncbi:High-affinity nickel-transporter [Actinosynnema sp. NPDC020468]|uniref:nickel/cobalt transporter n=1 Tax=Actinosynnema sp. NPDC020468 TaxID=3154488 RepID=UPI0033F6D115